MLLSGGIGEKREEHHLYQVVFAEHRAKKARFLVLFDRLLNYRVIMYAE